MKKRVCTSFEAEKFLKKYIPVSENQLVRKYEQITLNPPLVLKIISPQALHKTEVNGIKIVKEHENIKKTFDSLVKNSIEKKIKLEGIMVQKYYEGEQFLIGIKKDPVFGHVIVLGFGGVYTELFNDISIRKCPIKEHDAEEMMSELKSKKIFEGFRGKTLNTKELKKILVKVSQIPKKKKNILELDINPLILNSKEAIVVDARIIFG